MDILMTKASFFTTGQIIELSITLGVALILTWLVSIFFRRCEKHYLGTTRIWHYAVFKAIGAPLIVLIWIMALSLVAPIILISFGVAQDFSHPFSMARQVVTVLCIFWAIMRYVHAVELRYTDQIVAGNNSRDRTSIRALSLIIRCIAVIVLMLMLMHSFGIPIGSLLAEGGVGGIALACAAKDTLSNFLGGMMVFWDRPFSVGDWISSPDRDYEGTVEDIGWRLTRIRTFDKRPLYIPNGTFSTIAVENPSRMTNRRIKTTIALRYEDASKVAVILEEVETMLRHHPEIDTTQTLMVYLTKFGDSSLDFLVYTFTKTTDWAKYLAIQQDVFLKIIGIILQHGAECAFPSRTLYVPDVVSVQQPSETV